MTLTNKRLSIIGVGRDGKKLATVPVETGMHGPGMARATEVIAHPDLGKPAKTKAHDVVPVHGGMTARQQSGGAMGHATSAAPLDNSKLDLTPLVGKSYPLPRAANKGADCDQPDYDLGARIIAEAPKPR